MNVNNKNLFNFAKYLLTNLIGERTQPILSKKQTGSLIKLLCHEKAGSTFIALL